MKVFMVVVTAVALTLSTGGAQASLTASAVRDTQKIRPGDPPGATVSSLSLSCAQNEFCAFQIAVSATSAAATLKDISLGTLAGPSPLVLSRESLGN